MGPVGLAVSAESIDHHLFLLFLLSLTLVACYAPGGTVDPGNDSCTPCASGQCARPCLGSLGAQGPVQPPPYSMGTCPTLVHNDWNRSFGSNHRDFRLDVPPTNKGPYGVVFMWHGAGNTATDIEAALKPSFDQHGYILVVTDGKALYDSEWQVEPPGSTDDLRYFDDVLRCIGEQIPIDRRRVHSMGFSVGARFTAYLVGHRSDRLASVVTWSGGDRTPQGLIVVPSPAHPIPALLYHGGDTDTPACCGKTATQSLVSRLKPNGNFLVVCNHALGHTYPPTPERVDNLWRFFEAHPFMPGNQAAWQSNLPTDLPSYCALP
jgi:dienelactone hydrolase